MKEINAYLEALNDAYTHIWTRKYLKCKKFNGLRFKVSSSEVLKLKLMFFFFTFCFKLSFTLSPSLLYINVQLFLFNKYFLTFLCIFVERMNRSQSTGPRQYQIRTGCCHELHSLNCIFLRKCKKNSKKEGKHTSFNILNLMSIYII